MDFHRPLSHLRHRPVTHLRGAARSGVSALVPRMAGAARRALLLGSTLVVGLPASAALGSWSAPVVVSSPRPVLGGLQLFTGAGSELAIWRYAYMSKSGVVVKPGLSMAVAKPGQPFGAERPLPHARRVSGLVDLGGGRFAELLITPAARYASFGSASVALGRTDGRFQAPLHVPGSVSIDRTSLAGDARGDLVLAWISEERAAPRKAWASIRPAGGSFGPPQLLSSHAEPEQVSAAVGAHGDMVVAFSSKLRRGRRLRGLIQARVRRDHGAWDPLQDVGPGAIGNENDITPFVTDSGETLVAWYHEQRSEGGELAPGYTQVAVQPPAASRFRPAQLLERDAIGLAGAPSGISPAPVLVARRVGLPLIVFVAPAPSFVLGSPFAPTIVEVTTAHGLAYAPPHAISPSDQQASAVAAAAGPGSVIVTWIRNEPRSYYGGTVFAAVGDPLTGSFAAPEQISPPERAYGTAPTYNPGSQASGSGIPPWTVVWASRPTLEEPLPPLEPLTPKGPKFLPPLPELSVRASSG